jgi:tRNA nucleotidyltransferase (CCA-adding enzyme)
MFLAVESLDGLEMIRSAGDLKRFASSVGLDAYLYLEALSAQRCAAFGMDRTGCRERTEMYERIVENDEPVYLTDLVVNGADLIEIGIKEGIGLGRTLAYLLDYVHENPKDNEKKLLLDLAYAFEQTENDRG